MGAARSVPSPDVRAKKAMALCQMSTREMALFWGEYRKIAEKERTEKISATRFYREIDEVQNKVTDGVFRLLQIDPVSPVDFGSFLQIIVVVCLFEKEEIIKFCFFVFDRDKNGYVDCDEFEAMLESFYNVGRHDEMRGFLNAAKSKLDVSDDGRIDFREMVDLVGRFPSFFYPFFRLQNKIMARYMGHEWWRKKKARLHEARHSLSNDRVLLTNLTLERIRKRRVRRRMGPVMYYLFPWRRTRFFEVHPKREVRQKQEATEEEQKEQKKEERMETQRLADIITKNPETLEWHRYLQSKKRQEQPPIKRNASERRKRRDIRRQRKQKGN